MQKVGLGLGLGKESGGKLYGSRSRQLSSTAPQKESGGKKYGSRSVF
jgi:hypothetical protein